MEKFYHPSKLGATFKIRDVFQKHTCPFCHFIPFFYFTQRNNTVHVVFFCTGAFQELEPNTGCGIPMSGEKLTGFSSFCYYNLPFLKNINFIRGTFGVFVRSLALALGLSLSTRRESFLGT